MLYEVFWTLVSLTVVIFGLMLLAGAMHILLGSRDAYNQLRSVSKGFWSTMFGDIRQPDGRGGMIYNRGVAYSVDSEGHAEHVSQAKTNRESVRDSSA